MLKLGKFSGKMKQNQWPSQELVDSNVDLDHLAYLRPVARPLMQFTCGHFSQGAVSAPHQHPCVVLHGCIHGPITFVAESFRRTLESGQFYLLPPNEVHHWEAESSDTVATIGVLVDTDNPGKWPANSGVIHCCRRLRDLVDEPKLFSTAANPELRSVFWQAADILTLERPCNPLTINSAVWLLLSLAADLLSPKVDDLGSTREAAKVIRRILLTRVYDSPSVEQIAREANMSLTQAKKVFQETYGCGIKTYLNQLKLYQAKRLLGDERLSIEQVSLKLGFSSSAYFCRMFRARTGRTPSDFRKNLVVPPDRRSSER